MCLGGKRVLLKSADGVGTGNNEEGYSQPKADSAGRFSGGGEGKTEDTYGKFRTLMGQVVAMVVAISEPKEQMLNQSGEQSESGLRNQRKDMSCSKLRNQEQD